MHHAIIEYQFRLDVQRFLWPVYYLFIYITRVLEVASWGVIIAISVRIIANSVAWTEIEKDW